MGKPLDQADLLNWLNQHYSEYASDKAYDGKRICLSLSGSRHLQVKHGNDIVFEGSSIPEAVEAYNNLMKFKGRITELLRLEWPSALSKPAKFLLTLSSTGKVSWYIDDICYGENRQPKDVLGHLENLLGSDHEACHTLGSFFRARDLTF